MVLGPFLRFLRHSVSEASGNIIVIAVVGAAVVIGGAF
jgi:hypothetical protein